jgi:PAS domain S-box-containing protein
MYSKEKADRFDEPGAGAGSQAVLAHVLQQLSRELEPQAVLETVLQALVRLERWPGVWFAAPGEEGAAWKVLSGEPGRGWEVLKAGSEEEGLIGQALRTGTMQLMNGSRGGEAEAASRLAVPLLFDGQVLGVISLACRQADDFSSEEVIFIQSLAAAAAIALQNARRADTLRLQSGKRKQDEAARQGGDHKLLRLLEIMPIGVSVQDATGKVVFENPALERILDISREELDSGTYRNRAYLAADSLPMPADGFASAQAARLDQAVYDVETGVVKEDGETVWVSVSAVPLDFPDWKMAFVTSDITSRKQVEHELRQSERRYRLMAENTSDVIWVLDPLAGKFTYVSPSVEKLRGYTPQEVLAQPVGDALTPESLKLVSDTLAANLPGFIARGSGTLSFVNEVDQPCKDGSIVPTEVTTTYMFDEDGKVQIVGVSRDIRQRRQAERALQEARDFLYKLFHQDPIPKTLARLSDRILVDGNEAAGRLTGYSREDYLGKTADVMDVWADRAERRRFFEIYQYQGYVRDFEMAFKSKSGEVGWASVNGEVIEQAGEKYFLTEMIDITGRKRAELALRQSQENFARAFDTNPAALAVTRLEDGHFLRINAAHTRLMGYEPGEILGRTAEELEIYAKSGERQEILRQLTEYGSVQDHEVAIRTKSGALRDVAIFIESFPFDGQPCLLSALVDVTERKRMAEDLRRSNAELEQFAYIASHDLQEPLRTVAGMVQLLQRRYQNRLDERADEYIHYAVEASERMQKLINDLLDYSRVDRQGRPFQSISLDETLVSALGNLRAALADSQAHLTHDPLPVVRADPVQMVQVWQNLVGNAIKFRAERPLEIHIGVERDAGSWRFAVRDNGIGIDPQYFERVFLVFQRLHTRSKYAGTGIGLALCKKIIERHGGKIWIESQPGQGSTFYFTLPEERP